MSENKSEKSSPRQKRHLKSQNDIKKRQNGTLKHQNDNLNHQNIENAKNTPEQKGPNKIRKNRGIQTRHIKTSKQHCETSKRYL
jgi:hypothetical protein